MQGGTFESAATSAAAGYNAAVNNNLDENGNVIGFEQDFKDNGFEPVMTGQQTVGALVFSGFVVASPAAAVRCLANPTCRAAAVTGGTIMDLQNLATSDVPVGIGGFGAIGQKIKGISGSVIGNPGIAITGLNGSTQPFHAIDRIVSRGLSPDTILSITRQPAIVFSQWGGNRYLYISSQGAVTLTSSGQIVTVMNRSDFGAVYNQLLQSLGVK